MDRRLARFLVRSAMFMGVVFLLLTDLIFIYIPIAQGRAIRVYEDNPIIAFSEVLAIIIAIIFLLFEYVELVKEAEWIG